MKSVAPILAPLLAMSMLAAHAQAPNATHAPAPGPAPLVQGRVINEDGQPLPGATILVKGTRLVFSTNADGFFAFPMPRTSEQVLVSLLGYAEAELALRPNSPNAVTLQLLPGTRIRQGGRHHGKVLAVGRPQQ